MEEDDEDGDHRFSVWELPDSMNAELLRAWEIRPVRWLASWSQYLIMMGGFAVGALWLWPASESANDQFARDKALQLGALMYDTNFGFGMLVWLFAWVLAVGTLAVLVTQLWPGRLRTAYFLGLVDEQGLRPFSHRALDFALERSTQAGGVRQLIDDWVTRFFSSTAKYSVVLFVIGAAVHFVDLRLYTAYSLEGYHRFSWMVWEGEKATPWSDADRVELGCNGGRNGGSLVYEIYFREGGSIRIEDGMPVGENRWLDSLEAIDGELQRSGATFERWTWLDRNPLHPGCVRGYYGQLGAERGDRLMKLLRVGEFPGDDVSL